MSTLSLYLLCPHLLPLIVVIHHFSNFCYQELNRAVNQAEAEDRGPNWEQKSRERHEEKELAREEKEAKKYLDQEQKALEVKAKLLRNGKPKIS